MCEDGCYESVFVEIKLGKFSIICGNVYRPPSNDSNLNSNFFDIFILSLVLGKLKREKMLTFSWAILIVIYLIPICKLICLWTNVYK